MIFISFIAYDEIFNPESLQLKMAAGHRRQDSGYV